MDKILLHEISFYYGYLNNINNKRLIEHILKNGKKPSNEETDTINEDLEFKLTKDVEHIAFGINEHFRKIFNKDLKPTRFWSQVHLKNHSTNTHDHLDREDVKNSPIWSAVYYLQCDEKSGYFCFQYSKNGINYDRWKIKPEVGKFIIFPSYIEHFVSRNLSNKKRIALSFNFSVK
jgi:hypothetical protein